jgi:3-isopropylmalate/(R)-2-methylmalate dehydratase large subunit
MGAPSEASPEKGVLMARTLLDKVWEAHTVRTLPSGQTQLLIGLHLIHEVTTPQAFQMLKELKLKVRMPERTFATLDHIIPTTDQTRPYADPLAEEMAVHMIRNARDFGVPLFDMSTGKQGIVHVIGPELGLSQPGMTIACGDSHTSTHGAVGAIAFGIGTTQVRDVLATQCLAMAKPKLRQVRVEGALARGVYAKDVILAIINTLGVKGGVGYAYEYAGSVIERMTSRSRAARAAATSTPTRPRSSTSADGPTCRRALRSTAPPTGGSRWPPTGTPRSTTWRGSTAARSSPR